MVVMNEVDYFSGRARHYLQRAQVTSDAGLRQAFEAVAREFLAKAASGDPAHELHVIDGVVPDL